MTEGHDNHDHQPYHDREQLIADAVAAYHDLLFLGIGIVRLQQDLFRDSAAWPLALLVVGFALMLAAANLDRIKRAARRNRRRER